MRGRRSSACCQTRCHRIQRLGLRGEKPPIERTDIGDAAVAEFVDQRIIGAVRQIVVVLHTDDIADAATFHDLPR